MMLIVGGRAGKTYLHKCITLLWLYARACWYAGRPWDGVR